MADYSHPFHQLKTLVLIQVYVRQEVKYLKSLWNGRVFYKFS